MSVERHSTTISADMSVPLEFNFTENLGVGEGTPTISGTPSVIAERFDAQGDALTIANITTSTDNKSVLCDAVCPTTGQPGIWKVSATIQTTDNHAFTTSLRVTVVG